MRILLTSGATREPLDAVRFISNISTGATGAALARALTERGHEVTFLRGKGGVLPKSVAEAESFETAADLRERMRARLSSGAYDAVLMAAAVSDYRPEKPAEGKICSDPVELQLRLVRNEKILPAIRSMSPRPLIVIGFKLTAGADSNARQAAVAAQFASAGVDAVIHNDLEEIRSSPAHPFRLHVRTAGEAPVLLGTESLADALCRDVLNPAAGRPRQPAQRN